MKRSCWFLAALVLVACGDDDAALDSGTDAGVFDSSVDVLDAGPAVDTGPDPMDAGPDAPAMEEFTIVALAEPLEPIEGVAVAFDIGGSRFEGLTDADGHFVVSGFSWGEDSAAVTCAAEGYSARSMVGVTEEALSDLIVDGVVPCRMGSLPATETVTLSGTVTGASSASSLFSVYTDIRGATAYNAVGPNYSIEVPAGVPFHLTALETGAAGVAPSRGSAQDLLAVNVVSVDALDADAVVDVDLSDPLPFIDVEGSIAVPAAGHQLHDMGRAYYRHSGFPGSTGFPENIGVFEDPGTFEYRGVYWEVPEAADPTIVFQVYNAPLLTIATVDGDGVGPQDTLFLDPPIVVTPTFGEVHPVHAPIVFTTMHPEHILFLGIVDEGSTLRWSVSSPADGTQFTIPQLPSGVSEDAVLTTGALSARLQVCDYDHEALSCRRQAYARTLDFER